MQHIHMNILHNSFSQSRCAAVMRVIIGFITAVAHLDTYDIYLCNFFIVNIQFIIPVYTVYKIYILANIPTTLL